MFKYTLNTGNVVGSKSTSFSSSCAAAGFTGERILGVDWFSGSRHGFGQLTRLLQHAESQTGTQLTKRAPLDGDSETRTLKGPGEATWASRRAVLASLREPGSPSIGHFQQVHAAAPLTRRPESSSSDYLAPQALHEGNSGV